MLELCADLDLATKSLGADFDRHLGWEDPRDYVAAERDVTRHKNAGHSAAAQLSFNGERTTQGALELVSPVHARLRDA
jgi:hypothetical protein